MGRDAYIRERERERARTIPDKIRVQLGPLAGGRADGWTGQARGVFWPDALPIVIYAVA